MQEQVVQTVNSEMIGMNGSGKKSKHFVLKNINPEKIDRKYNFQIDFNLHRKELPKHCTRIDNMVPVIPLQTEPIDDPQRNRTDTMDYKDIHKMDSSSTTVDVASANGGGDAMKVKRMSVPEPISSLSSSSPNPNHAMSLASNISLSSSFESSTIKVLHSNLKHTPRSIQLSESIIDDGVFSKQSILDKVVTISKLEPWCSDSRIRDSIKLTFMDECKKEHQCVTTHLSPKNESLAEQTILHCFWCRHPFPHRPVSVPLSYVPNRIHKQYQSEITNDTYILRENIDSENKNVQSILQPSLQALTNSVLKKTKIVVQPRDYYISDGTFCSFNCALAFIRDQKSNPIYCDSETLLTKIYHDTFGMDAVRLQSSPSWRLLRNYGGHLTIEDFRRNLFKIDYKAIGNLVLPTFRPIGFLFERQVRI